MNRSDKQFLDATAILALIQGESGAERLWGLLPEAVASLVNAAEVLARFRSLSRRTTGIPEATSTARGGACSSRGRRTSP